MQDSQYKHVSLWTDIVPLRWLRSLPHETVVVDHAAGADHCSPAASPPPVSSSSHRSTSVWASTAVELRNALAAALPNVSVCVTLTQADRAAYQELLGPAGPPVVAIPNAVPDGPHGPGDPGAHKLIAAGRFARQKGFDLLLEAFATVAIKYPDLTLDIFGRGPQRASRLSSLSSTSGLGERVRINAPTDRLGERMRDASVFVLSSRYEGFPLVLLEAMAAGLAVVSFDCPTGPAEILTDGTSGLLVPAEDVQALAATLDRVMADELAAPTTRRECAGGRYLGIPRSRWVDAGTSSAGRLRLMPARRRSRAPGSPSEHPASERQASTQ